MTAILFNRRIRMSVVRVHPSPLNKSKRGVDMNIEISNHAFDSMHERLGLNKKAIIRMVEKAYELGLTHNLSAYTNGYLPLVDKTYLQYLKYQ